MLYKLLRLYQVLLAVALSCCAAPTKPYVGEVLASNAVKWGFSRPKPVVKVLYVHNPLVNDIRVLVHCPGNVYDGRSQLWVTVKAKAETSLLISESSVYQYDDSCEILEWHFDDDPLNGGVK